VDIFVTIVVMAVCLATEAFFTGSEIGVVSADRIKLRHDAAKGSPGAKLALDMLKKPEWLLSTTLVGTNISVVANTTIATALVIQLLGEQYSWVAVVIVAPLIWVFGEIVPKSIFQQRADTVTPYAIFALRGAAILFYPILIIFTVLSRLLARMFGNGEGRNPFTLREEIVAMMEMPAVGSDIEPIEQAMIRRVFNFDETTAGDIMVPLADVVGIEAGASCGDATRRASRTAHKRLPVFGDRPDNIVGTVNALDMLLEDGTQSIGRFVRPPTCIRRSHGIGDLLATFRSRGGKGSGAMAVVVDESGRAEGIVTLEDILEEVVGEIEDEYDGDGEVVPRVRRLGERNFVVNARIDLQAAEQELGLTFPRGDYETLAGFLLKIAREIPADGAVIRHRGVTFTVKQANAQAIEEVRVIW
jgi:CBS domain containing-hemolysin-like protein